MAARDRHQPYQRLHDRPRGGAADDQRGKRGKVINIGSLTSEVARATVAPYTAAKGGIKMLTRAMAAEWAEHGIQANAIGPGYMVTDMNKALIENPEFDAWVKGRTPARRWGKPEELVGAAVFLASAASDLRQRPDHLCRRRHARRALTLYFTVIQLRKSDARSRHSRSA